MEKKRNYEWDELTFLFLCYRRCADGKTKILKLYIMIKMRRTNPEEEKIWFSNSQFKSDESHNFIFRVQMDALNGSQSFIDRYEYKISLQEECWLQ